MKKSYNLFGLYLDHVSISNAIQYEADYPADIQDYNIEYNLFDMEKYERRIPCSELLKCNREEELYSYLNPISDCDKVILYYDLKTDASPVLQDFYLLRTKQLYTLVKNHYQNICLYLPDSIR